MVVTGVQDFIAAEQVRSGEQLIDAQRSCGRARSRPTWSRFIRTGSTA
jgi:hypothetical protein